MLITIFTPTYNRQNLLLRLYKSLKSQKKYNFEWIIVDDGSTDDTKKAVDEFIKNENSFDIKYIYKENGGKQTAINNGIQHANGALFFIVDSDDYLLNSCTLLIEKNYEKIKNEKKIAALSGTRLNENLEIIGKQPISEGCCKHIERKANGIYGDKAEVYKTEILIKYPFPEFEGEKFCGEDIVWNRISHDGYKIYYLNEPFVICEYQEDGITKNWQKILNEGPNWNALYLKEIAIFRKYNKKQLLGSYYQYYKRYNKLGLKKISNLLSISKAKLVIVIIIGTIYSQLKKI